MIVTTLYKVVVTIIILGGHYESEYAVNYAGNPHDSKTIEDTLKKVEQLTGQKVEEAIVDRGYRSRKKINDTQIVLPDPLKATATGYQKWKMRKRFRRRAAIEPIIGHLKNNYRMNRNYLKGEQGDVINAVMAGAAFNFKRWLNQKLKDISGFIQNCTSIWLGIWENNILFQMSS